MTDYYAILGVARDASQEDIRSAYRRLARRHHPDTNAGDAASEERFKQVTEAYEVLADPARRQRYDMFGDARGESQFGFGDLGDIMETFFGGASPFGTGARSRRRGPERGEDLVFDVQLKLEEAARGCEKQVTVDDLIACERCTGSGSEPGTFKVRCGRCGGSGAIRSTQRTILGTMMTSRTCPTCSGDGQTPASPCTRCRGSGVMRGTQTVPVKVPAGVADGMSLRVGGKGRAGPRGGPAGDLYVRIGVKRHKVFDRVQDDLHCTVSIPFTVATLGGDASVPTLEGEDKLRIEAGTQSGTQLRLRGRGVAHLNDRGSGDIVATLVVETPRDLTAAEREIVARLAALRGESIDEASGIVSKLRGALRKER